jgi:DNA polymerase
MSESSDPRQALLAAARAAVETEQLLAGGVFARELGAQLPRLAGAPHAGAASTAADAAWVGAAETNDAPAPLAATAAEKAELLATMDRDEVRGCTRCPLHQGRTRTVFGVGDPDARLMFIGEGPGADEDAQGEPFVGRAGKLLTKMIVAMGLSRETVYIANVVKCRPPGNRAPRPDEASTCWPYLRRQIQIVAPEAIVVLGNAAAKMLLETRTGITRLRGQWREIDGVPVMPTFHPAYLLRQYTEANRRKVWNDLQAVMDRLGLDRGGA